ncbi:MAG: Asd/ArgC dimerization domain-containing protein [Acidobacteriota bacterium]
MATSDTDGCRLVLVGATTPLGAGIRARLGDAGLPLGDAVLAEFDAEDEEGGRLLSDFAGEARLVVPVEEVDFRRAAIAVLCGDPVQVEGLLERASAAELCIDASGACRGRRDVPWVHVRLPQRRPSTDVRLLAVPQPVSTTLATLLEPLARDALIVAAHATVLLPASSLGERAAEELYQQTLGLLNFTELPRQRLAHQLAFNILPWEDPTRPGSRGLATALTGEVEALLGERAPACDLQLLLAPTFHGYGYSVRLQTRAGTDEAEVAERLQAAGLHVAREGGAPASPVEALQQGEQVLISRLHRVAEDAIWAWAVADSLGAGAAENLVELVRERLASRPA